jgi:hypothetical protein
MQLKAQPALITEIADGAVVMSATAISNGKIIVERRGKKQFSCDGRLQRVEREPIGHA